MHEEGNTSEDWRAVLDYEGTYEVSSIGSARSLDRIVIGKDGRRTFFVGQILRQSTHSRTGYRLVSLKKNSHARSGFIHRLVAESFYGPVPKGMLVRHLNGDRTDNRVENLAIGTYKENAEDAILHGGLKVGSAHHRAIITEIDVAEIRRLRREGKTIRAIASAYPVGVGAISDILRGKNWKHVP